MAIYTSRYSNKELRKDGYYPVGISVGRPRFNTGYTIRETCYSLAPKGYMLKMEYDPYKEAYIKKLEEIGTDKIIKIVRGLEEKAKARRTRLWCFFTLR